MEEATTSTKASRRQHQRRNRSDTELINHLFKDGKEAAGRWINESPDLLKYYRIESTLLEIVNFCWK